MFSIGDSEKPDRKLAKEISRPVHVAGVALDHRAHICAFFNSPDEEYRVLAPFTKEGIELGQKNVHTVDPDRRAAHCERLASAGVDLESAARKGQFELRDWSDTHMREGKFDSRMTLELFRQIMEDARRNGFPLTRFVTNMEWTLEAGMDGNALLEYEATANDAWIQPGRPVHPVVCVYDLRRFTADIIVDVMRTHPLVIIGGLLRENPYFVPPEKFLEELRGRVPIPLKRVG